MKKSILVLILFLSFINVKAVVSYDELDKVIENRQFYIQQREDRIKKIKIRLQNVEKPDNQYALNISLFYEFQKYTCDSAIYYLQRALDNAFQLKNQTYITKTKLELIFIYASSGIFEESLELLQSVKQEHLTDKNLMLQYYITCESLYGELKRLANEKRNFNKYETKRKLYEDSILMAAPSSNERILKIREASYLNSKQYDKALTTNDYRISKTSSTDPKFSIIAFDRFLIEREMKNLENEKKFLIQSAICDLTNAVRDNASLSSLANILHSEGEIERAYRYIKVVQEDAAFYNARLRFIQVSSVMPIIEESFRVKSEQQKTKIIVSLIAISGLAVFLLLSLFVISKQKKKLSVAKNNLQQLNDKLMLLNEQLRALNHELSTVNHIKEEYIGQFLNICSVYIDKMDAMRKTVVKGITSGKVADIQKSLNTNQLIEKEVEEFYQNFDEVFLHIFPNFVSEFNDLLIDSERIELKKGELLNVELRIFALIRLGINDSAKIAKLLRYSVNTIYNYRAKVKNKVKASRDEFETTILNIGSYEV